MGTVRLLFMVMIVGALFGGAFPAFAAETDNEAPVATPPSLEERLQELDQKVRVLERTRELAQEEAAAKAKETPVVGAGKDGFFLKSANGDFQLKLRGYVQADSRFFLDDKKTAAVDQFLLRRVRPIIEGTLYKYFDFRIMPDFGGGKVELQDAYLDIRYQPEANLKVGKFKAPVGLERLQSGTDILFVERALPTDLVPNRDLGFQLHGEFLGGALSYAVGVFNGVADGASTDGDNNNDKEFAGRVFARPFKGSDVEPLAGLGFGVAGSYGDQDGALPSYKTTGQEKFFSYQSTATAAGVHYRISPQGYYYWDALGLLGEYVFSSQEIKNGTNSAAIRNDAWQVALSYLLTGENASYKGITPKQQFDPRNGTWGAFELAARLSRLNIDDAAFTKKTFADITKSARTARAIGGGVNWYLNRNVKAVLDYEQTSFDGGSTTGDRVTEKVIQTRFQIAF